MGYCLAEVVSWYQRKIGTYDKQPWEKTVEQRILNGFTHVPKKTAKLKTDLIDVDLVRGSSFTKVKPKHGIVKVTKFALVRLLLLPAFYKWWSQQVSHRIFLLLLVLYVLEICNVTLFVYACYHLPEDTVERVGASEVVVPGAMMLFLAVLHSEIVSPHSVQQATSEDSRPRRRYPPPKRRLRQPMATEKLPPTIGSENAANNFSENCNKFPKRIRCRRLSFEEGNKRHRRSVAWDVSPVKAKMSLTPDLLCEAQDIDLTKKGGEDDGFESFNSTGLSDHSETGQQADKAAGPQSASWQPPPRRASLGYCRLSSGETDHKDSDSDESLKRTAANQGGRLLVRRRGSQAIDALVIPGSGLPGGESSYQSSDDGEVERCGLTGGCTTSAAEWMGITTNSEDCSDDSLPTTNADFSEHPFASEFYPLPASAILSPSCASSDKVSCTMWEKREVKKAELSVLDISSAIIARVEAMPENMDYFYGGMVVSVVLGLVPVMYRLIVASLPAPPTEPLVSGLVPSSPVCLPFMPDPTVCSRILSYVSNTLDAGFGHNMWERCISVIALIERFFLSCIFFFLLAVAERTFKQKFLYAKFFSHLTSFRRARKSELPHFRLNKVRNIKTWLSVRSYLKKRGPQHSVDAIVSSVFLITLLLISFLSVELLKDSEKLHSDYNIEALVWCIVLGLFLLRFMTLGTKINRKYRNLSVLITEQINLYLQIEQKPNKKDELMVANSVLKLAADLLKELECPYKISGFSANPYLYTITKVVILSALSGVLSEMLGFKLKLHKIKIK